MFSVINWGEIIAGTAEQKIHPKCWQILHTHCFYNREGENTLMETDIGSDISTDQVILLAAIPLLLCSVSLLLRCSAPLFTILLRSLLLLSSDHLLLPCSNPICSFCWNLDFSNLQFVFVGMDVSEFVRWILVKGQLVLCEWLLFYEQSVRLQTKNICMWLMFYVFTIDFECSWMLFVERFSKISFINSWIAFFPHSHHISLLKLK